MATPERRTAPSVPAHPSTSAVPAGPVPVVAPAGWMLILVSGIGMVLASWTLFGVEASGMWAGYRVGFIGTVVIICAMLLNTSLPAKPTLGLLGLLGILTVLFGVFIDQGKTVMLTELIGGAALLVGTGLYGAGRKS
ncbi:hypothetical protein [Nocardioides mangrovi]|uniref:Uncharacterized protein n=1 Tax=Nocardioides mangrovi TaxID=2874580 RepID=A0ABS7UDA7_9ACTN|nr:hypothetical protein [Nocardioides mangrovi]MBZ5738985.1 hypothetical protein [Nocardioides mangrovi]